MNPAVSLLVPAFNREKLLVPCLDSALAQTFPDLEVVVVDGASTDGTWEVCQRYASADSRVRVFRDEVNTGPVRGWWRCLEEARGTHGTFLWSDDVLRPTFLEMTLPQLADKNVGFAFTAAEIGAEPGEGKINYSHPTGLIRAGEFIEGSLRRASPYPVSPACALFRLQDLRDSFVEELPTEPKTDLTTTGAGTDLLLYLLTALRYAHVACVSEPLAFFRAHPGSLTIDGRQGIIALNYALTMGWFAVASGHRGLARATLARHWLREMRTSHRFRSPSVAAERYRHLVGSWELMRAAVIEMLGTVR